MTTPDPIQSRLNLKSELIARLAGIQQHASLLMDALDAVGGDAVVTGVALHGVEQELIRRPLEINLETAASLLHHTEALLVREGFIAPPERPVIDTADLG